MHSPEQLFALYDKRFDQTNFNNNPSALYAPVHHIMSIKGKRIRPLLLLMSCDMLGGNLEHALNPAFAVEVFHNFSLVHDDIMDSSDIRRGVSTVHKMYGLNAGILAGDVMLAYAYKYLTDAPPEYIAPMMAVFNKTTIEIFEGQQLDIDFEKRDDVAEAEYLKMIEYKTSVLLAASLQLGAIVAGAAVEDQKLIYEFGLKLGLSFQIKDDYLDAFGEQDKVGKRIGGDILMNKKTFLFVTAQSMGDSAQKDKLIQLLRESDSDKKIAEVKSIFEYTGAQKHAMDKAEELYKESLESLHKISVHSDMKKPLALLAERINNREF